MTHLGKKIVLAAALAVLAGPFGAAQSQPAPTPAESFEVASVKPNKTGGLGIRIRIAPGGRFNAENVSVKMLIGMAYHVQPFQITGGPGWLNADRYDIEAKAPDSMVQPPMNPDDPRFQAAEETRRRMVQSLLADRFHLQIHRETKEMPVYALVVAKSGSRLQPSALASQPLAEPGPGPGGPPRRFRGLSMGPGQLTGSDATTAFLAQSLSNTLGRTVLDETGLKGNFDFKLKWTPDESQGPMMAPPGRPPGESAPPADGPSIFTALQEQLGLKLESKKGPVEILVIDHAEQPSEN